LKTIILILSLLQVIIFAEEKGSTFEEATDLALEALKTQIKKFKDKKNEVEHKEKNTSHKSETANKSEASYKTTASPKSETHKPLEIAAAISNNQEHKLDVKKESSKDRQPSSLPSNPIGSAVGKFTVQIYSTQDENEAYGKSSTLKKKGYSSFYLPTNVHGKTWYRVNVGQFNSPKEAVDYKEQLMKNSIVDTAIIQKITN